MSSTSASRSVLVLRACDRHEGVAGAPGQIPPADSRRGGCFCDGPVVGEDAILARLSPGTKRSRQCSPPLKRFGRTSCISE